MEEHKKWKKPSYIFKTEDQLINFGINEGKTIGEIIKNEPKYIDWCVKNFKGFKLSKQLKKIFDEVKKID
jgi:hypothetical protein